MQKMLSFFCCLGVDGRHHNSQSTHLRNIHELSIAYRGNEYEQLQEISDEVIGEFIFLSL